ncbi:MAG: sigma-B regulation protein RsbU (phosphoserine phosphatase) [Verrucomicrobiales bacterium]|jgi:sigma-B regulation protein RsbU (phosphoserine phosphatase)
MTALPYLLIALLFLLSAGFFIFLRQQHKTIVSIRESRDAIEGEEHRLFDFLHGLGRALQTDFSEANMHRYIVEGIIRVLEANGAALYILDASGKRLVPKFVSGGCPPLIALPDSVMARSEEKPNAMTSYIRLQSIDASHPVYGQPLENHKTLRIDDLGTYPAFSESIPDLHDGVSLLIGPAVYAGKPLGLLMVARQKPNPTFSDNDLAVCNSLTDQSAYALGSAMIHKVAQDKSLLDAELRTASEFQRILLPAAAPKFGDFEIAGVNYPAKIVSGDYFDYVEVDEDRLGIAIADVSGKGVPASLIMATCRSVLRAWAPRGASPSEVLKVVNEQIFPDIREDMFITMAYLILNRTRDSVTLSRAGHNPPFVFRKDSGEVVAIEPVGMALGIDSGGVFERVINDYVFDFKAGDVLFLYTDGVDEAINPEGDEYGVERIRELLKTFHDHTSEGIISRLSEDLRTFVGSQDQSDDITLIAIKKGS